MFLVNMYMFSMYRTHLIHPNERDLEPFRSSLVPRLVWFRHFYLLGSKPCDAMNLTPATSSHSASIAALAAAAAAAAAAATAPVDIPQLIAPRPLAQPAAQVDQSVPSLAKAPGAVPRRKRAADSAFSVGAAPRGAAAKGRRGAGAGLGPGAGGAGAGLGDAGAAARAPRAQSQAAAPRTKRVAASTRVKREASRSGDSTRGRAGPVAVTGAGS